MRQGSSPDFAGVYDAYHGRVLAYVTKLIGRQEAEDVTQEVFVKIDRSLGSLVDPSRLASWVYAVALNTVRDAARRRSARVDRPLPATTSLPASGEGPAAPSETADPVHRTPEEAAIRNEMIACYLGYVEQLPRNYREVYVLSEFEDLSCEEIASRLSLSPGAVKIRLHRARSRLNEELRRNCRCYHNERGELMAEPKAPRPRPPR